MNYGGLEVNRLYRWLSQFDLFSVKNPTVYPRQLKVLLLNGFNATFRVYSDVENYRLAEFGGEREFFDESICRIFPQDTVFDIGASVGLYTVGAASVARQGHVYAFEPDPETRERLAENSNLNEFKHVTVLPWALSDTAGATTLYSDGAKGFAPSLVMQDRPGAPTGAVEVQLRALDRLVEQGDLPRPDVLKIDIEGAEWNCLLGAQRILKGDFGPPPRLLLIEIHPQFLPTFGASPQLIYDMLSGNGYRQVWSQIRSDQEQVIFSFI